jgi:tetratricopeptide (TPR) repeat protein
MTRTQHSATKTHPLNAAKMMPWPKKNAGKPNVQELLTTAMRYHRSGHVDEAGLIYRQILQVAPNHADALHLLGLLAHQAGQNGLAADLIGRAISQNRQFPGFHSNLGIVLQAQGKLDEAVSCYRRALALRPDFSDAHCGLGIVLKMQGKLDEAVASLELALTHRPDYVEAHSNLGNALREQGRLEEAAESYKRALSYRADYVEAHNNLGNTFKEQGKLDEAVVSLGRAVAFRPDYVLAYLNLGIVLTEQGKLEQAAESYRRALSYKPDYAEAHSNLGNVLKAQSKLKDAIVSYRQALAYRPDLAEAHNNLGIALKDEGRLNEAITSFEQALMHRPAHQEALNNLGTVLMELGKLNEARACYYQALQLRPDYTEAYSNLGIALKKQGNVDEAVRCFRLALTYRPEDPVLYNNLGAALAAKGAMDEAIAFYHQALSLHPDYAEAYNNLGIALAEQGKIDHAAAIFRKALTLDPQPKYYRNLADIKPFSIGDHDLSAMEAFAQDITSLSTNSQVDLSFALGKAYDDCGKHELAFKYFHRGNALKRQQSGYDETAILERMEATQKVFNADLMARLSGYGNSSSTPIFILGMPRSGSTLIEQVLASHSQVLGGGERLDFPKLVNRYAPAKDYPAVFHDITPEKLSILAASYLDGLPSGTPAIVKITDKMLENFLYAGLIHLALPNARIIHTRRDPVDTCLSCFFKLFRDDLNQTYDLAELGRYYLAYNGLMEHWRRVLPASVFIEVNYEILVSNFEEEARRIVNHCGLAWDSACLSFHETQRIVQTASLAQVRQPINNRSVGRWHNYSQYIQRLLQELNLER